VGFLTISPSKPLVVESCPADRDYRSSQSPARPSSRPAQTLKHGCADLIARPRRCPNAEFIDPSGETRLTVSLHLPMYAWLPGGRLAKLGEFAVVAASTPLK
jgi:hypothetical protein